LFPVNFYSFTKEVNSTAQPAGSGTTYQCQSNANFDIISPRLPLNIGAAANPTGLNYCKVPAWSRYYWVTRWAFEGGLWVAYCSVDPLASWKTQIGQTSAYVVRAAAASDGSIVDHMYPTKAGPAITKTAISSPWPSPSYDSGYYCVGVINKDGATEYYKMSPSKFASFCAAVFDDNWFNSNIKDSQAWMTKAIFDPMQYLSSVTWFPAIPGAGFASAVYLGYWDTGITAPKMNDSQIGYYNVMTTISVSLPSHPQAATRGAYLNSAPYTNRILDLKPFGRIAIDANAVAGESSITLEIVLDYITGIGILRILRGSDSAPLATQQAQVGLPVQVSQVLRDYFGGALNVASSAVGAVGSLLTGNIAGAIQGGLSAIGGAVETAMPDVTTSGHNGGFAALYGSWFLVSTFYQIANEDQAHRGRPLCQVRQLNTLPGYQLCTDTDIQIPCTRAEMDAIRSYLEGGYYYE
jgi:hypothetical protein